MADQKTQDNKDAQESGQPVQLDKEHQDGKQQQGGKQQQPAK